MKRILNGKWTVDSDFIGKKLEVNVPGSIYNDLISYGLLEDPYYRDNEYKTNECLAFDYTYETNFEMSSEELEKLVYLGFDGIDTIASVYVNDQLLFEPNNQHRRFRIRANHLLVSGNNNLKIVIHPILEYILKEREKSGLDYYTQVDSTPNFNFVRKAHCMFGWDWGPKIPDGGINKDVYVEVVEGNTILDVEVVQETTKEVSKIDLKIENEMINETNTVVELWYKDSLIIREEFETKETNTILLEVNDPKLWNPIGYGEPNLYKLIIKNLLDEKVVSEKEQNIGLRDIQIVREKDQYGESFYVKVNGNPIFIKGSNYIIEDNILPRTNYDRTRTLLEDIVKCNHNSIRVWGGALYPTDYFYDICDELGILVWQDLMFACCYYDATNKEFLENIRLEIIDNVNRIKNHPSLALICGNNENELALEWNPPNPEIAARDYLYMCEEFIPSVMKEVAPHIFFWLSSPSSGGGFDFPNDESRGDMHYWGVWHSEEPIEAYRDHYPRFMSEYGLQSFPCIETIKTFAIEEDMNIFSYVMECHQKNVSCNQKIFNYISKMFKFPNSFESLIYLSQIIQAKGIKYCAEHMRRNYPRCMGSIYWQLNDCWPVASWSSIDYFGRYKALQYFSKKFYNPILLSLEEDKENSKLTVNVNNETLNDFDGFVMVTAMKLNGEVLWEDEIDVSMKALSAKNIREYSFDMSLKEKHDFSVYARLVVNGEVVSENDVEFVYDKHLQLIKPNIEIALEKEGNKYSLTFNSDVVAKYVEVKIEGYDFKFSDNFFNLIPGIEKTITFECDDEIKVENIKLKSLTDSF